MNKKPKLSKVRHSSLDLTDPECAKNKKSDVLSRARLKFLNLSDALRHKPSDENKKAITKSMTQSTLEYFFGHKDKNHVLHNSQTKDNHMGLKRQNSVDSYPIRIEITAEDDDDVCHTIHRSRPATICVEKPSEVRNAEALALERPRKKLSFREPEVIKHREKITKNSRKHSLAVPHNGSTKMTNGILHRSPSFDDSDLESQAMRVVRTIGQAFEVCHRLQIEAPPEPAAADADLDDGTTQDLLSERLSDAPSDRPADRARHRDLISDGASDKASLPPDDSSYRDSFLESHKNSRNKPPDLDILPPPPSNNNRKINLVAAETYAAPHSDGLGSSGGGGSGGSASSLPTAGGAPSAHHELQLLREQLSQQSQQTREALAQLQLTREQLAAEQSARLEAQARTHQLLVHNRELLDHIAALVAHLQGDKSGQQQTPPHVAMPQLPQQSPREESNYISQDQAEAAHFEVTAAFQALGLGHQGLIENRRATTCLPPSPLRTTFNPSGGMFNFPPAEVQSFESQWLQRLQALSGYSPGFPYALGQQYPFMYGAPSMNNNNYPLHLPPAKKMTQPGMATLPRYSGESRFGTRSSEPRQMPSNHYQSQQNLYQTGAAQYNQSHQQQQQQQQATHNVPIQQTNYNLTNHNQSIPVHHENRQTSSINPQNQQYASQNHSDKSEGFIKPLAQMGTLTTTDSDGRVRVIVPVPDDSSEEATNTLFSNLRIGDDGRLYSGPMGPITRTASEKVPNRSELMDQLRATWSRHTTK